MTQRRWLGVGLAIVALLIVGAHWMIITDYAPGDAPRGWHRYIDLICATPVALAGFCMVLPRRPRSAPRA